MKRQSAGILNLNGRKRLPMILQAETSECGLACVAMVSSRFGHQEDLSSMRSRVGNTGRGATLNRLISIATDLGLTTRALRCEVNELASLATPAILHWDFNHFVVLAGVNRRGITIHDPAVGVRDYPFPEVGHHFTGIALELAPGESFKPEDLRQIPRLGTWFSGVESIVPALAQILLLSAILQVTALATPFYVQLVVDEVLVKHDVDLLTLLGAGFLGLCLFSVVTQAIRGWAGIYLTHQLSFFLGARLFRHLLSLSPGYFAKRHMGDLVSRFGSLKPVQDFLTSSTIAVLLDGLMAIATLCLLFLYAPLLTVIVLATIGIYLAAQLAFYLPLKMRSHESIAADARVQSHFMESIRSISAIKRFGIESSRNSDWLNRFTDAINADVRTARLSLWLELIEKSAMGIGNVIVVLVGARLVLAGELTIGMLYAFLAWRSHLTTAMVSLVNEYIRYLMLSLHLERLADIQMAEPENPAKSPLALPVDGAIRIAGGGYRYSSHEQWVFRQLDLEIEAGESLAIFGPSGCGKSTLVNAMQGLLTLDEGELRLDEQPIGGIGLNSLRAYSASVMQGDTLLTGSIQSNITFGESLPDHDRLQESARLAAIHDDIHSLPMGYETLVGEMGAALSAGQIQRLLIARALYRQPQILFLDEGTAHLDRDTERTVMENILALGITTVFITHNKAILGLADKVLLMAPDQVKVKRVKVRAAA